jgi:hypothetical protein
MSSILSETIATFIDSVDEFSSCMLLTGKNAGDLVEGSYKHFKAGPDVNFRDSPTKIFDIAHYNISYMINCAETSSMSMAAKLMLPHGINSGKKLPKKLLPRIIPIPWSSLQFCQIDRIPSLNKDFSMVESENILPQNHENIPENEPDFLVDTKIYNATLIHAIRICFLFKSNQLLEKSCGFMINPAAFPENYHLRHILENMSEHEWLSRNKSDWIRDLSCSLNDWGMSLMYNAKKMSFHVLWDVLTDIDNMCNRLKLDNDKFWRDIGEESMYIEHLKTFIDLNRLLIGLLFKQIDAVWDRNLELSNDLTVLLEKVIKR